MPLSTPKRERVLRAVAAILMIAGCLGLQATAQAAELPRIASINVCTDQLLMALADPAQILGLSPYARDPSLSWDAAKASQFPKLSGTAEDVLVLKPDLVVAGRWNSIIKLTGRDFRQAGGQLLDGPADAMGEVDQRQEGDYPDYRREQEERVSKSAPQVARY